MSKENINIQDCLDNYLMKGCITILRNGQVVEFRKEVLSRGEKL